MESELGGIGAVPAGASEGGAPRDLAHLRAGVGGGEEGVAEGLGEEADVEDLVLEEGRLRQRADGADLHLALKAVARALAVAVPAVLVEGAHPQRLPKIKGKETILAHHRGEGEETVG